MKQKLAAILVIVLAIALPAMALAETVSLAYPSGALNLRDGAGTQYESLGTVHDGDHITVLEQGSVWSKIKTDSGKVGYIKNLYISGNGSSYASGTTYFDGGYTVYTTAAVNFRAGAGTNTASMGTLSKGTKLTALGKNNGWYLVKNSKGTQGFVSGSYLTKNKVSSGSSSTTPSVATRTVTARYVNVRADGGMSAPVITVLKKGTKVEVLKKGNYWTKISYKGTFGWIKSTYLK